MTWLLFALIGPSLWALANVADSALRKKWIANDWALAWIFSLLRLPVLIALFLVANPFQAEARVVALMTLSGFLLSLPYLFYYRALKTDDSSLVAVFIQTIPVFNLMISAVFLRERLTMTQGLAFGLLFSAGLLAALRLKGGRLKFRSTFGLLLLSSILWAISDVLYKATIDSFPTYMDGFSLYMLGSGLTTLALLGPALKTHPIRILTKLPSAGLALIMVSLAGGFLGTTAFTYALTLGKVSLTSVLMGIQPLVAFGINWGLAKTTTSVPSEAMDRHSLWMKAISFGLVLAGLAVLEM